MPSPSPNSPPTCDCRLLWYVLVVLLVAIASNTCFLLARDPAREVKPDATFYLAIAQQLARGGAYVDPSNFWPTTPTMGRAPGWPFVVSLSLRLFPVASPTLVMRVTAAVLNIANAVIIALITLLVFGSAEAALLAGCAYAVFPTALYLADAALSEILFVFLVGLGCIGLLLRGMHSFWGALSLGLGCLVRSNFVLFPIGLALLVALRRRAYGHIEPQPRIALVLLLAFLVPVTTWMLRNYWVSGLFPVISTIRGETFYGSNNSYVANTLDVWGYWVFPDDIPGELPKAHLARSMSEAQLDAFYFKKGIDYVKTYWFSMPRLLLGKLIRAYAPVPWNPDVPTYIAFAYRAALYLLLLIACQVHRADNLLYRALVSSMVLVHTTTVLIFYGAARLTFAVEPYLLPFAAHTVQNWLSVALRPARSRTAK